MFQKFRNSKGVSFTEYIVMMIFLLSAYYFFHVYLMRGIFAKWHGVGDSYAFGRQYDPKKTIECRYDPQLDTWYDKVCFDTYNCSLDNLKCISVGITACKRTECDS